MGWMDWLFGSQEEEYVCPVEKLESYRRLGEQVYRLREELSGSRQPRALAYMEAATALQKMADALLGEAFCGLDGQARAIPAISHRQADVWYETIPELVIAARQEAAFAGSSRLALPVKLDALLEEPGGRSPIEHIWGLRRAAEELERLVELDMGLIPPGTETFRSAILRYQEARTRKEAADAIAGIRSRERQMSAEAHEDAEAQYAQALSAYLLVVQGLKAPEALSQAAAKLNQPCKLDGDSIWKVTSRYAVSAIRRDGEWDQAEADLQEHWQEHVVTEEERAYEITVEAYLEREEIEEHGWWYCCPFPSIYKALRPVQVLGRQIEPGEEFVYAYGDPGEPGGLIVERSFVPTEKKYCED
ncbi:hypothetical protein B5M42_012510 [Paenibacillus athensensis]|uniref:Uncharacterized protein n=1 Tax=Paenibacillus athensensis TaxID=1967502 RepID=A0A4Y8PYC5_9BACL|nr:hypothetical protein [Paenibacillus athensensis]MCD1259655.1 hypothetical protein [Paenibacillus athensensis]